MTQINPQGKTVNRENNALKEKNNPPDRISEADGDVMGAAPQKETDTAPRVVFTELVPATLLVDLTVIPAECVGLHAVSLPMRSARQRMAALPFALEGEIGQGIEGAHMALCGAAGAEGNALAAVVATDVMAQYVARAPAQAVVAEQTLIEAPPSAEDGRDRWRCYRKGDRVLVRASDGTGFAAGADALVALWHLAGQPAVESFGEVLPQEIGAAHRPDHPPLDPPASLPDLRQGAFQPDLGLTRPLKWLAAACVIAAVGQLGIAAADARAQRDIADDLQGVAQTALEQRLPGATPEAAPALIQRQLAAQNQPQSGSDFLPLMNRVSTALAGQPDAVQFRQLSWSDDTLRLTLGSARPRRAATRRGATGGGWPECVQRIGNGRSGGSPRRTDGAPMKALDRLTPRERVLILGGGSILVILAVWFYVWQPIAEARATQQDRITRYLTLIDLARRTGGDPPVAAPVDVPDTPLAQRITQSGEAAGIPLARLDPDGDRLRITVAEAAYSDLIPWIAALESQSGVRALSVEMSRLTGPGMVSLRMMVENAS